MVMKIGNVEILNNIVLAPMAGYGDLPFRRICRDYGAGLTTTEMVSAKGLCYASAKTAELLKLADNEKPNCVQLFGGEAEYFSRALELNYLNGFDIIDINFGCPVAKVTKSGEGSALMSDFARAEKIISACVNGAGGRPVTAKFRLGRTANSINCVEFALMAQSAGASALTIHGRTATQMYSGVADWQQIARVASAVKIPVLGNGDITSETDLQFRLKSSGCAGLAVGRGALGNPQIFSNATEHDDLLTVILRHIDYSLEVFPAIVTVRSMRKHLPFYLKGVPDAKKFKQELNYITDVNILKDRLKDIFGAATILG